ncbi:tRNA(Ile)-lysidine synthase [Nitrosomonas cryotolerans]|uniref:tRNA(Ile)-lysidine synthase n=1 Tax=Nitrosomonas cryotolerans ATCC 49181 TaxID=1131553 RepID=A0A1N6H8I0_9PROT|nr:tRNA lysidine(34) synthetase TilS [Nitrosomonas cryotolerans]SFP79837.1 tRNA(Ile)-lysidine synthase [Nitrosomonas cryotolerans]SIO16005.1 tRNA(Ile)-lysidine synthase [Nitrosomonas cryotolerans ATCC 49181]
MVLSRKLKSNNLSCYTEKILHAYIKQNSHLVVALSGGVDSVVLLHLLVILSKKIQFTLSAVHVDHGISNNATAWSKFCCDLCHAADIPITVVHLKINKHSGISLEAAARNERYQVFNQLKADYVVLAQHLDDQAETLLLQLLRGAGAKGLGAMPIIRKQPADMAPYILRPLLEIARIRIEEYAKQNKLSWITDESNNSIAFNRNYLRHQIFPLLKKRYPGYQKTLLRTSRHLAEASNLLDELAEIDYKNCTVSGNIQVASLHKLSLARARNLLRYVFSKQGVILPSTAKLADILHQLLSSRRDNKLHVTFGNTEIRCYKGIMYIMPKNTMPETQWRLSWHGEKQLFLADLNGTICFIQLENQGINIQKLMSQPVTIRPRLGGERFYPDCKRPRRSLKNLLQEARMPPWKRKTLPLLFCEEHLVWVPEIGIDCNFQVKPGESGLVPVWEPTL